MKNVEGMMKRYNIVIVRREFQQSSDDYHATVSRLTDGVEIIRTASWRWLLKWRVRRKALDRAYRRHDNHQRWLAKREEYTV